MAKKYAQLDSCLLEACGDIQHLFRQHDMDRFKLLISCHRDKYDPEGQVEIKFTVCEQYDSGPSGYELGEVIQEFIRRRGWDIANNTKLITSDS